MRIPFSHATIDGLADSSHQYRLLFVEINVELSSRLFDIVKTIMAAFLWERAKLIDTHVVNPAKRSTVYHE